MVLACGLWLHKQKCPRPREKWQKKDAQAKGKRRRNPNASKTSKRANGNANLKSDAQTPASDDSSPADTSNEAPDTEENENDSSNNEEFMADDSEPQLPQLPRSYRASSADPGPRGLQARTRHRPAERQVQSSPGRATGAENMPIEVGLTPKPLRRQLFPSPEKGQVRSDPSPAVASSKASIHLPAFVRRSPRLNKTKDVFSRPGMAVEITVDGKENAAPAAPATPALDDGLDHLFEEGPVDVELPPMTPTPKRRSERILLKTPSKTPSRQFGSDLPLNADLHPSFRTPKAKVTNHHLMTALLGSVSKDVGLMTPFTRSIHDAMTSDAPMAMNLLEEEQAHVRCATRKNTPNKAINFDFPDLPSLKNSSPLSSDQLINFNLSEMTTDQLNSEFNDPFNTNSTLPSSPPAGLFTFLDTENGDMSAMWDEMIDTTGGDQAAYPDPTATGIKANSGQPRRSPRKQQAT